MCDIQQEVKLNSQMIVVFGLVVGLVSLAVFLGTRRGVRERSSAPEDKPEPLKFLDRLVHIQMGMHIVLCAVLKGRDEPIDHEAVGISFKHIISAAAIPTHKSGVVEVYLAILRGDARVMSVFGNTARVREVVMIKTGLAEQAMAYRMHLLQINFPIENARRDVVSPEEFSDLVDNFMDYSMGLLPRLRDDRELMAILARDYGLVV